MQNEEDQTTVTNWKSELVKERQVVEMVQKGLAESIATYLKNQVPHAENHQNLLTSVEGLTDDLTAVLDVYDQRTVLLASYFDKASKIGTLAVENYEKMEECIETIRSELKDVVKRLCTLSTLEMDYYEKLLGAGPKSGHVNGNGATDTFIVNKYYAEYEDYRRVLNQIHRYDQIRLYKVTVTHMLTTIVHLINKFWSVLDCGANVDEIRKLWSNERYQY